jgi:hypothetical protein
LVTAAQAWLKSSLNIFIERRDAQAGTERGVLETVAKTMQAPRKSRLPSIMLWKNLTNGGWGSYY